MACHVVMMYWQRKLTLDFLSLLAGIIAWSCPKNHSPCDCFRWSLNSFFTTSNTAVVRSSLWVWPQVHVHRAVLAFISCAKWYLQTSNTSASYFYRSTPDLLVQATENRFVTNILQWFLKAASSLGFVLQFRIILGVNLLPSPNTTSMIVTCIFSLHGLFITYFTPLLLTVLFYDMSQHNGISLVLPIWLRMYSFILQSPITCCWRARSFSSNFVGSFWQSKVLD